MVLVKVRDGWLKGREAKDARGSKFYSFQGIPYAEPPVGHLRFKAPKAISPWPGIKDAIEEGNECLSKHMFTRQIVGSEDCLNLNVYTPNMPKESQQKPLKPVMFWIHGGIFATGSNKTELFGPEFFMPEDVVLVTINYRLGMLGFLSLEDSSLGVPGNAAFKDMVLALKWVQMNITNFSGDPNNVTVFGESAGGCAAHLLMLSPMAKGLFHRVIAQSGCALNTWIYGRRTARHLAHELGFYSTDERKLLPFLQNVAAVDILKAQFKLDFQDYLETEIRCFGVVVEKPSDEEPFLTENPIDIIYSGKYNHVPLLMGYNHNEGMAFENLVPVKKRDNYFYDMELSVPFALNLARKSNISKALAQRIQLFYFETDQHSREKHMQNYFKLCTDTSFFRDIYFSAKGHILTSQKPIYFYRLSLESELNLFKNLAGFKATGVYHADDLGYLFKTSYTPDIKPGSIEDISQRRFVRLWSNFARYSNPTPDVNDHMLNIKWEPLQKNRFNFLNIGEKLTMSVNPENERMNFWENIYKIHPVISKL